MKSEKEPFLKSLLEERPLRAVLGRFWAGSRRMTESAFELARSGWSCISRRSLNEGGFGGNGPEAGVRQRISASRASIFDQKSIKKLIKIQHRFLIVFRSFWSTILEHFGRQNRPKLGPIGVKTALEAIFFEKSEFSRQALKTHEKSTKITLRGDRK